MWFLSQRQSGLRDVRILLEDSGTWRFGTLEGQCQVQKAQPSDARVAAFFSASHPNFQAARAAAEQPTSLLLAIPSIVITKLSI